MSLSEGFWISSAQVLWGKGEFLKRKLLPLFIFFGIILPLFIGEDVLLNSLFILLGYLVFPNRLSFWDNCQRNIVVEFKLWEVLGYSPFEFCFSVRLLFCDLWNFTHKMRWNWILWYNNRLFFQYQIVN